MSDAPDKKKSSVRRQRSICQIHYDIKRREEMTTRPIARRAGSPEVTAYSQQVAGHRGNADTKYVGLLQCSNGTILKPILKESQRREVDFYSRLARSSDADLRQLRALVARYFGLTRHCHAGATLAREYIVLEDLTLRMLQPCVMDVKIGRRTWDPLATEAKIKSEQSKYALCKQQYAFCIPGYQVYRRGAQRGYDKEHGKKLHGQAVKHAFKNFLNGLGRPLCRALVLQLLTQLWRVHTWSRRQTALQLYSASLLLIYDAARLRECCGDSDVMTRVECRSVPGPSRRRSIHSMHTESVSFSGQLTAQGPHYKQVSSVPTTSMALTHTTFSPPHSSWSDTWEKLNHNHSFDHNYEDKLSKIKMNYRATLDQLSYDSPNPNPWGTVKIIDFAHAFFNEEEERSVDDNFREGVESLVEIFEDFLRETNDQVV